MLVIAAAAQSPPSSSSYSPESAGKDPGSYRKTILMDYYVGRTVRARVPFPATRRGLEILDGQIRMASSTETTTARPGAQMLITQVRFKSRSIDLEFGGEESSGTPLTGTSSGATEKVADASRAASFPKTLSPRLSLKFSRDITMQDLTVPVINQLLSAAVEVTDLLPKEERAATAENPAEASQRKQNAAATLLASQEQRARDRGIPVATVIADLPKAEIGISELTIECSAEQARLYVDGAFSGSTPRSIRLRAGVHTILIISPGFTQWEESFFIPAGKVTQVRAELQPIIPK